MHAEGAAASAPPSETGIVARFRLLFASRYAAIWPATALLFLVSPLIASGSLNTSALQSTLPFAAVLAIVGIGQTLVIQQRGLDLSVPGMVSLSAILVTKIPASGHSLGLAVLAVLGSGALAGAMSGIAVTRLNITPLVATLGINAVLLGTILKITSGSSTATASPSLASFAFARVLGVSSLVLVAVVVVAAVAVVIRSTPTGRRFVAVGTSPAAAHAAGMWVRRHQLASYVIAAEAYGLAGVLLAGFLKTPGLSAGNNYLLPSIAAVVLGGTSLAGGGGSVVATAGGALFLSQLQQVVYGAGAPASVQLLVQSVVIGLGMAVRTVPWRRWASRLLARQTPLPE